MHYVYILQTENDIERHYTGVTADLRDRLVRHDSGQVLHTRKYGPWRIKTYVAFSDEAQAFAFE